MKTNHKNKNWIYDNFKKSIEHIKSAKNYFLFSLILFFIITILSFFFPIFYEKEVLELIRNLILMTQGMNTIEIISFIIFNNIKSAFFAMVLGIFLGIVPVGVIIANAYILGFVSNKTAISEGIFILWKLLPHGIFEIPAVLLATALGIKLGLFLFTHKNENKLKDYFNEIIISFKTFLLIIIPFLVIAGIIEGILIGLTS